MARRRCLPRSGTGDGAGRAERHEELAYIRPVWVDRPQARELLQRPQLLENGVDRAPRCIWILFGKKAVQAFEVAARLPRDDYLCHFGMRFGLVVPSDWAQASTSSSVTCRPVRS